MNLFKLYLIRVLCKGSNKDFAHFLNYFLYYLTQHLLDQVIAATLYSVCMRTYRTKENIDWHSVESRRIFTI